MELRVTEWEPSRFYDIIVDDSYNRFNVSEVSIALITIPILYRRICLDSERINVFDGFSYFTNNLWNKRYQELEHTFSRVFVGK